LNAGALSQTILEMAGGYLFVTSVSQGATLAVYAERRCDIGLIGYEMTMLAARVGHALTPAARTTAAG
jgi:predicted regulator of Ras-like GTPase activity (Roadblock/LC7/MglB family)